MIASFIIHSLDQKTTAKKMQVRSNSANSPMVSRQSSRSSRTPALPTLGRTQLEWMISARGRQSKSQTAFASVNTRRIPVPNLRVVTSAGWRPYLQVACLWGNYNGELALAQMYEAGLGIGLKICPRVGHLAPHLPRKWAAGKQQISSDPKAAR